MNGFLTILQGAADLSTPLILAALAGLVSERSGVINIALEGKMLMAACFAALVSLVTGSPWLGFAAGIAAAMLVALLHLWLTQAFRTDHVVSGMGINALALGGTTYLSQTLPAFRGGRAEGLPGPFFWGAAVLAAAGCWFLFAKTTPGLRISAVGQSPDKARLNGLDPVRIRLGALLGTGLLCGLAGAMLAGDAGGFVLNMTSGRGYIALAALILGRWKPIPALGAAVLFGAAQSLQLNLQGARVFNIDLPSEVWQSLPYVLTLLALAVFLGNNKGPAGLGKP
jgi:simple sugar transport system permease protein